MVDSLGDRCKAYEQATRYVLPPRIPKILRLDGRAFHTFLKYADRPYDKAVMNSMIAGATQVMQDLGGVARFAYIQSDEVTIGINDGLELNTQMTFGGNVQKIVSVFASVMSGAFNGQYRYGQTRASFDARIFCVPDRDLNNVVLWRQQDAARNSVQQYARHYFSHNEVQNKSNTELQDMLWKRHNFNWNNAESWTKRGVVIYRRDNNPEDNIYTSFHVDWEIPLFNIDKEYIPSLFYDKPKVEEIVIEAKLTHIV